MRVPARCRPDPEKKAIRCRFGRRFWWKSFDPDLCKRRFFESFLVSLQIVRRPAAVFKGGFLPPIRGPVCANIRWDFRFLTTLSGRKAGMAPCLNMLSRMLTNAKTLCVQVASVHFLTCKAKRPWLPRWQRHGPGRFPRLGRSRVVQTGNCLGQSATCKSRSSTNRRANR